MAPGRWGVHVPTEMAAIRDIPDYLPTGQDGQAATDMKLDSFIVRLGSSLSQ